MNALIDLPGYWRDIKKLFSSGSLAPEIDPMGSDRLHYAATQGLLRPTVNAAEFAVAGGIARATYAFRGITGFVLRNSAQGFTLAAEETTYRWAAQGETPTLGGLVKEGVTYSAVSGVAEGVVALTGYALNKFLAGAAARNSQTVTLNLNPGTRTAGAQADVVIPGSGAANLNSIDGIHARLQSHVDEAVRVVDSSMDNFLANLVGKQPAQALRGEMVDALRGLAIERYTRQLIAGDAALLQKVGLGRMNRGADVFLKEGGTWWDITTPKGWPEHLRRGYPGEGRLLPTR